MPTDFSDKVISERQKLALCATELIVQLLFPTGFVLSVFRVFLASSWLLVQLPFVLKKPPYQVL